MIERNVLPVDSAIDYKRDLVGVDWAALKEVLRADDFDNGRTPEQLEESFAASAQTVLAYAGEEIVGTARALSDGVCNAYVVDVWTVTPWRRRGIATRMMQLLMEDLPGQHVALFTDEQGAFYESLGLRPRGVTYETVVGEWLKHEPAQPIT